MGKLLDRLKTLPLVRRKNALLFDALKRAESQRHAARAALAAIAGAAEAPAGEAKAAETPAEEGEDPTAPSPAN